MANDAFDKQLKELQRQATEAANKVIRETYKDYIKPNVLIRLKTDITNSPIFYDICNHLFPSGAANPTVVGQLDSDLCSNLALINWYWCLGLTPEEKNKKYDSKEYTDSLKQRALLQCRLKPYIKRNESELFYSHTPIMFSLHCVINSLYSYLLKNVTEEKYKDVPNFYFKYVMYEKLIRTCRSLIIEAEITDFPNAYATLRTVIENLFIFILLYNNSDVAEEYFKFIAYKEYYDANGKTHHREFIEKSKGKRNKLGFLNYGWLDKLYPDTEHKYNIEEIIELSEAPEQGKDTWINLYHDCSKFVHGRSYSSWGREEDSILDLGYNVGLIIETISSVFCSDFNYVPYDEYTKTNLRDLLKSAITDSYNLINRKRAIKSKKD